MRKLDLFTLTDTFSWTRSAVLKEALVAAKRRGEVLGHKVKAVAILDTEFLPNGKRDYIIQVYGEEWQTMVADTIRSELANNIVGKTSCGRSRCAAVESHYNKMIEDIRSANKVTLDECLARLGSWDNTSSEWQFEQDFIDYCRETYERIKL